MKSNMFNFSKKEWITLVVVSLGYYFDAFDIILFSALRKPSLIALGVKDADLLSTGITLLNWQLLGLVLGGIIFGVLSDKFGRRNVLFASILLYSITNLANVFVQSVAMYACLRFSAGIGLAGELGVGIALITENIIKEKRTETTTIVSFFGMLGAISGGIVALFFYWKICYLIGFFAGMLLLALRIGTRESVMYKAISSDSTIKRGSLKQLLTTPRLSLRYLACTLAGGTLFTSIGIYIQGTPEFGKAFGTSPLPTGAMAVVAYYAGAAPAEIAAGLLSKTLKSRKKPMYIFYAIQLISIIVFCTRSASLIEYYSKCVFLGFSLGFWTLLVTTSAEQFGINLRGTASASIPNVARAWSIPFTFLFQFFKNYIGLIKAGLLIGIVAVIVAVISAMSLNETFEKDANFIDNN